MAYDNLCMYCFKELNGETVCPHCGGDSRAAVPQIQMLPGTLLHNDRFLVGRALGQDSGGIVYNAMDTKRGGTIRIREYLPRNCAERLNDGGVVPVAGMEESFETGMRKLRASVDSVEDPKKRHFYFEENGTAYIAQRKGAGSEHEREYPEEEVESGNNRQILLYIAIAAAVVLAVAIGVILFFNSMGSTNDRTTVSPVASPSNRATWAPNVTPTPTPYTAPTFKALVDPELSWMDYTLPSAGATQKVQPTQQPTIQGNQNYPTVNNSSNSTSVRQLQQYLVQLGWLNYADVTGTYDNATREAVRAFQHYVNASCSPAEKLAEDGIAGQKTQQWLYNSSVSLTKPTATPQPPVTAAPDGTVIDRNSSASAIRRLQSMLIELGLLPEGGADGRFGSATQAAVRNFQNRVNQLQGRDVLRTDGTADALTCAWLSYYVDVWRELHATPVPATATPVPAVTPTPTQAAATATANPNIDASSSREDIIRVQQLLQQVGLLNASEADGVYGSRTLEAVRLFQSWINQLRGENTLNITGVVDTLTLRYLEYCVDNHRMYDLPTATPAPQAPVTEAPATEVPATEVPVVTEAPTFEPTEAPTQIPDVTEVPPEQQAGDSGITPDSPVESIEFMQEMLSQIGLLDASAISGNYDQVTADAVRAFQQIVNDYSGDEVLPVTGQCDTATLSWLQQAYDNGMNFAAPTEAPTEVPTEAPTEAPTEVPTEVPTEAPTESPAIDGIAPESPTEEIREMQQLLSQVSLFDATLIDGSYTAATEDAVRALQRAVNAYNGREVLSVTGMCDSNTLQFLRYAAGSGMDLRELAGLTTPVPTEVPTPVPTDTPAPELTPTPTPEPTPVPVGTIQSLRISISGQEASGLVELAPGQYEVSWAAEGELQSYFVYLYDGAGNLMQSAENSEMTSFGMDSSRMNPGEVYELRVGALPVNGTPDDILWQSVQLMLPIIETPEPTPTATPAPTVSMPVISIGSAVYQQDGVPYINDSTAIFSWMADGQVESYTVNITYQGDGTSYSLGTTTDTSRTINRDQLRPGLYRLYVGATPVGGGEGSTVWAELVFGIPEPAATDTPVPEATPEPTVAPEEKIAYVDANSSAEDVQAVQMALYRYGLLNVQLVQPGVLDQGTLEAVAAFQQRVNESFGAQLYVIDPTIDAFVDAQTLELLLYQTLDFSAAPAAQ